VTNELKRIENIVAMAVGYNEARGDKIEVANIPFNTTAAFGEILIEDRAKVQMISTIIKYSVAFLLLILFYLLVIRPILKRIILKEQEEQAGEGIDFTLAEEEGFEVPKTVEDIEKEIEEELDERAGLDIETTEVNIMLKRLKESIDEDPTLISSLITAWLREA